MSSWVRTLQGGTLSPVTSDFLCEGVMVRVDLLAAITAPEGTLVF